MGHALDANTVGLWRFDEEASGDYATVADASGNERHFNALGTLEILGGPEGEGNARWFPDNSGTDYGFRAGDVEAVSLLLGEWTWEGWVYVTNKGGTQYFWSYATGGESDATNFLGAVGVTAAFNIIIFWETGAGATNVETIQSTGAQVVPNEWTHVAVRKTLAGSVATLSLFVNGELVETIGGLTNATGGTSSDWYLGRTSGTTTALHGALGSMRWSSVGRDDAEIAASAARETKDHVADEDTWAILAMAEEPAAVDLSGNGNHLRCAGSFIVHEPIAQDGGSAKLFNGSTTFTMGQSLRPGAAPLLSAFLVEFTVEWWARLHLGWNGDSNRGAWVFGNPGSEAAAQNFVAFDLLSTGEGRVFSEYGSGSDSIWETAGSLFTGDEEWEAHHFAVTKRDDGGGGAIYELYLDGVLVEESTTALLALDNAEMSFLTIGSGQSTGSGQRWFGVLDDLRISNVRRSAAEILASYEADASGGGGGGSAPVISNVQPPPGTLPGSRAQAAVTPIQFDATDPDGDLAGVIVTLKYASRAESLVVYDGAAFLPPFDGPASSVELIEDGFRFVIEPRPSWEGDIERLRVYAFDGNVSGGLPS